MAQLEGYRCPIVVRTAHIQPYDMPRYVGEVISQLHELSQWTTKCATMLNQHHPFHATPPMPKPSVPTTILSEVELLKRSLNVVEKQQSNKLVTEIAYLQCALRSEADEKMTAFEHFVETRLGQSIREHTHVLQTQQDAIATKMEAMAATMGLVRSEVDALQTRVGHVEEMLETNASVTSEALQRLHTEATHYAKQREKADLGIGNQLAQTRLHVQDAIGSLKAAHAQLVHRMETIRVELHDAVDHVRKNTQQHDKLLTRIARGTLGFEGVKITGPTTSPSKRDNLSNGTRPKSARAAGPRLQPPGPVNNQLLYANATLPSTTSHQEPIMRAGQNASVEETEDDGLERSESLQALFQSLRKPTAVAVETTKLEIEAMSPLETAPCYVLDKGQTAPLQPSDTRQFSLQPTPRAQSNSGVRNSSVVSAPAVGDRISSTKCDAGRGAASKRPRKPEAGSSSVKLGPPTRPQSARHKPTASFLPAPESVKIQIATARRAETDATTPRG